MLGDLNVHRGAPIWTTKYCFELILLRSIVINTEKLNSWYCWKLILSMQFKRCNFSFLIDVYEIRLHKYALMQLIFYKFKSNLCSMSTGPTCFVDRYFKLKVVSFSIFWHTLHISSSLTFKHSTQHYCFVDYLLWFW